MGLARPLGYRLVNYEDGLMQDKFWPRLPLYAKYGLCSTGLAPEPLCRDLQHVVMLASREELEQVGLHPGRVVRAQRPGRQA